MTIYLNIINALLRLTYWFCYAPMVSFASPVLIERGYSSSQIGVIIALGAVVSIFLQSFLASYVDNHQELSTIKLCFIIMCVTVPIFSLVFFLLKVSFVLSLVYIILFSIAGALSPFINNFTAKLAQTGYKVYFWLTFSIGAIGYSLASKVVGNLADIYGNKALLISTLVGIASFMLVLFVAEKTLQYLNKQNNDVAETKKEEKVSISYVEFIKHNKVFFIAMIGVAFMFFSDRIFYSFTIQIVNSVGGGTREMGTLLSVCSMCQIPGFLIYPPTKKRFSYSKLLCFAVVMYSIKALVVLSANSMAILYVSGLTRMFNYSFFTSSIIPFVNEIMPKNEANRGQTLYTIASSAANIIASFSGGYIIDSFGVKGVLLVAFIMSIIAMFIFIPAIRKVEKQHEEVIA